MPSGASSRPILQSRRLAPTQLPRRDRNTCRGRLAEKLRIPLQKQRLTEHIRVIRQMLNQGLAHEDHKLSARTRRHDVKAPQAEQEFLFSKYEVGVTNAKSSDDDIT